eukprot:scaffold314173_cov46-Tisochrysis_lutea.AAC.1
MESENVVYWLEAVGGSVEGSLSYIGYTTNLYHRLRQHNGEISGGARYTTKIRLNTECSWHVHMYVSGFVDKREALRFEYRLDRSIRRCKLEE